MSADQTHSCNESGTDNAVNDAKSTAMDHVLVDIGAARRATLRRLIIGTAFVAPIVASFAMDTLTVFKSQAYAAYKSGAPI